MESRHSRRLIISLPAEMIVGDKHYASSIENISDKGIYLITAPVPPSRTLNPDTTIKLKFKMPSGEKLDLSCNIKWAFQTPPHGYTNSIGLEIIDAPLTYIDQLNNIK